MSSMERAKQAWLELNPGDRVAFREFITTQEAGGDHDLKLINGSGRRAAYNEHLATLVENSQRSGWVDVLLKGDAGKISWRSGAWIPVKKRTEVEEPELAVPMDALALILAQCSLAQRLRAMPTCSLWAELTASPEVWSHLCTPLCARSFTTERLKMLLDRAGDGLCLLDIGSDAGRVTSGTGSGSSCAPIQLEDGMQRAHPLQTTLLSRAASNKFTCLHTLRFRYGAPWLTGKLLAQLVPRCTALEHLYVPGKVIRTDLQLRALAVPTLISLHTNLEGSHFGNEHGAIFTGDVLPLAKCPNLRTLSLVQFVHGYGHRYGIFTAESTPPALKSLRISLSRAALVRWQPVLPNLCTLYISVLKTNGPILSSFNLPNLQVMELRGHAYGPCKLKLCYRALAECVHLRFLRVGLQGFYTAMANNVTEEEQDDEEEEEDEDDDDDWGRPESLPGLKAAVGVLMQLPGMWFCETPHEPYEDVGWTKVEKMTTDWRGWPIVDEDVGRMVRCDAEHYDAGYMSRLEVDEEIVPPEIADIDMHPDVKADAVPEQNGDDSDEDDD